MATERERILSLAKVLIAAAWGDGKLSDSEKECLRDLIFHMPEAGLDEPVQLTAQEWTRLEMYMDSPVESAERGRLVAELQEAIRTPQEKELVKMYLRRIAEADGPPSEAELQVVDDLIAQVDGAETGWMNSLNRFLGGALSQRSAVVANAPNREKYFNDFLKNKVYYELQTQLEAEGRTLELSDAELRRLGLAGGLMARIANVDRVVDSAEVETIATALAKTWQLDDETALFAANVALNSLDANYDYFRMTREFAEETSHAERLAFLAGRHFREK